MGKGETDSERAHMRKHNKKNNHLVRNTQSLKHNTHTHTQTHNKHKHKQSYMYTQPL